MKTMVCRKCGKNKSTDDFEKEKNVKGGFRLTCRLCRGKQREDFLAGNVESRKRKGERRRLTLERNRNFIRDYLQSHPCVDCGETRWIVLEFDHVRGTKNAELSYLAGDRTSSLETIQAEVAKCEVRCANCHRIKTAKENGSWRMKEDQ